MSKSKRSFSHPVRKKSDDYHGGCVFSSTSPPVSADDLPSINFKITFEESLRFATAIQEAVLALNRNHRGSNEGKNTGLWISVKFASKAISVIDAPVN